MFNKRLPSPHDLVHRRTFLWVLLPTALEELPHLTGKSNRLSICGHHWSTSSRDLEHHRLVLLLLEWYLAGEYLYRKHPKSEYVGRLRLHHQCVVALARRVYDFWGQPSGTSDSSWSSGYGETRVRVNGCQPVLCQASTTPPINDNIRLSLWNQHYRITEEERKGDLNAASAAVEVQSEGDNLPPSNHRVGCRANEGTVTPSRRQTAAVYKQR